MKLHYEQITEAVHCTSRDAGEIFNGGGQYLKIRLPEKSADETHAVVTLNIPRPYVKGDNWPGLIFEVSKYNYDDEEWEVLAFGECTYEDWQPGSYARMPITVVALVELDAESKTTVAGLWRLSREGEGIIDSIASISAVTGVHVPYSHF